MSDKKTKNTNGNANNAQTLVSIAPPPPETAPSPPTGFDPTAPLGRGKNPWTTLVSLAPQIAKELTTSTTFAEDFGGKQTPQSLADLLTTSTAWRAKRTAADAWAKYVKGQDSAAWRATLRQLERFRKAFEYAVACDPTLAGRYPQTAEMFRARSAQSVRGAKTRASKPKDGAKGATPAEKAAATPAVEKPVAAAAVEKPAGQ